MSSRSDAPPPAKRARVDAFYVVGDGEDGDAGVQALSDAEILSLVQEAPAVEVDEASVRASAARLRRATKVNEEQRLRSSDPMAFVDSEVELHAAIIATTAVATVPSLYSALFSSGSVELLLHQLSHENEDIANAAVRALHELLDVEALNQLTAAVADEAIQRIVSQPSPAL